MILVARLSDWTTSEQSNRRKFQYGASAVHLKDGQVIVQLGSGDREKPLQGSEAANVVNRFYGIRDNVTRTAQSDVTPVTHSGAGLAGLANVTGQDPVEPETTVGSGGWYFNLVTTSAPYEQVVTTPLTIGGVTYFSTYQANGTPKEGACYNLGTARAYRVNFQTGTKLPDAPLATEFLRGGFAPSPVAGIALVDGKKVPFIIGGQGASQVGVDKPVLNPKKKRTPVYRYQRIDR
jgi:type IV pilus assembly protein PilY1